MSADGITRAEAERILGIHPQQMQRAIDGGWVPIIAEPGGRRLIKREGLEEAWANRPRRNIKPAKTRAKATVAATAVPRQAERGGLLEEWELPQIPSDGKAPNLEDQKAWNEFTKRYREQLALMKDAELLVYKEDYDKAQNAVLQEIVRQCERLPRTIQQRISKLTVEDMEEVEDMIRDMLSVIASAEFAELEE